MPTTRSGRAYTAPGPQPAPVHRRAHLCDAADVVSQPPLRQLEGMPAGLEPAIDFCRKTIAAGLEVEKYQIVLGVLEGLDNIEKESMPAELDGPEGLNKKVYDRISELKRLKNCDFSSFLGLTDVYSHASNIRNVDAVIEAYLSGALTIEKGKCSCWAEGKQISPLQKMSDAELSKIAIENGAGQGKFWLESPPEWYERIARRF